MAKTRALARPTYYPPAAARPQILVIKGGGRGGGKRRRSGGFKKHRKGHGRKSGGHFSTAMAIPAVAGSAAVGWIGAKGYLAKLPEIGGSRMNTLALVGYGLMRFTKSPYLKAAGFGALCVGAFNFGRLQGGGGIAGEDVSGLDDVSGDVEGEGSSAY